MELALPEVALQAVVSDHPGERKGSDRHQIAGGAHIETLAMCAEG